MDRLISEQAVIDRLTRWYSDMLETGKEQEDLIEVIKAIPSAEPKIGYREYNDIYDHYLCGNCKTIVMDYDNFCPNCGARMVEEQERSEV